MQGSSSTKCAEFEWDSDLSTRVIIYVRRGFDAFKVSGFENPPPPHQILVYNILYICQLNFDP